VEVEQTSYPVRHAPHWFRRRKDGAWEEVTRNQVSRRWNATAAGLGLRIGERQEYRDFSF
jgi:hypothetical protein